MQEDGRGGSRGGGGEVLAGLGGVEGLWPSKPKEMSEGGGGEGVPVPHTSLECPS